MRASRLLSILLLLQVKGRLTAERLAEELEVSVRTIYRDVGALHDAGVPIYGDSGPDGGYQLLEGYRTRLTGFTASEAEALFLAGMPGPAAELGLGTVVAAVQLKLQAALPAELAERAASIEERFLLDAPGWFQQGDGSPHLAGVAEAVWGQHRIQVRYRSWQEQGKQARTRTLDPYGVVLKGGRWYVVAHNGEQLRTYRINQISGLSRLQERFERPADFDLAAYWASYLADFRSRLYRSHACVRLSPLGRRMLSDPANVVVLEAIDATASEADAGGWVTAEVPIETLQHAEREFLRLGAEVDVLGPPELRRRMATTARRLASLYDSEPARPPGVSQPAHV